MYITVCAYALFFWARVSVCLTVCYTMFRCVCNVYVSRPNAPFPAGMLYSRAPLWCGKSIPHTASSKWIKLFPRYGNICSFTLGVVFPVIMLGDLQTRLWKVPLRQISFHQIYRLLISWFSLLLAPPTSATKEQLGITRSVTCECLSWQCGFHLLHAFLLLSQVSFVTHNYVCLEQNTLC